jgi:hypothetical protein
MLIAGCYDVLIGGVVKETTPKVCVRKRPMSLVCVGLVDDWQFYKASAFIEAVIGNNEDMKVELKALVEPEWEIFLAREIVSLGGSAYAHEGSPFVCLVSYLFQVCFVDSSVLL